MKTSLASLLISSALGIAMLAASFTLGGSGSYAQAPETISAASQTITADNPAKLSFEFCMDNGPADESCLDLQVDALLEGQVPGNDQESSTVGAIAPASTDVPAIESVAAIVVEITQSVAVVVPGEVGEPNEDLIYTGSVPTISPAPEVNPEDESDYLDFDSED